jgi:hypothetical protein
MRRTTPTTGPHLSLKTLLYDCVPFAVAQPNAVRFQPILDSDRALPALARAVASCKARAQMAVKGSQRLLPAFIAAARTEVDPHLKHHAQVLYHTNTISSV